MMIPDTQLLARRVNRSKEADNKLVFSYLTMRNLIGFCGMLLPFALAIVPSRPSRYYGFEPSISDYFYTDRGDLLVVLLCVLGVFLLTYYGYNWKERLLTLTAAICGMGVAFVPTQMKCDDCPFSIHTNTGRLLPLTGEGWHLTFAAVFLLCLAVMSLVFFRKTDAPSKRKENGKLTQKAKRDRVYLWCGWTMIGSVAVLGLYFLLDWNVGDFPIIFFFETVAVVAFGISWLTKGETFWPDGEHYISKGYKKAKAAVEKKPVLQAAPVVKEPVEQ